MIQLSYRSTSTADDGSSTFFIEIARILEQSLANNPQQQITGALAYHAGAFVQVLEGPAANVDRLLARIRADPRHSDCRVITRKVIKVRSFGAWSMAYVGRGNVGGILALLRDGTAASYDAAIAAFAEAIA